jgi:SprT protein
VIELQPSDDELAQGTFQFLESIPPSEQALPPASAESPSAESNEADDATEDEEVAFSSGPDLCLEDQARQLLLNLGMEEAVPYVKVLWNPRLKSTAGYAAYPSWRIELNPRLTQFEGQVDRTLRHELAHLVAYHRAGRRRIEPHGPEWQRACADLGIPNEPAHHRLPLPRTQRKRGLTYQCPQCRIIVKRVQPFKRPTACLVCCRAFNNGRYNERFRFFRVQPVS